MKPCDGRQRVVIEDVTPQLDAGSHPIRRVVGEEVVVTAAIFADGHDQPGARVLYRHESESSWRFVPMQALGNDGWRGVFAVDKLGPWRYTVLGWIDHFATWAGDLEKRLAAQIDPELGDAVPAAMRDPNAYLGVGSNFAAQDIPLALSSGAMLVREAASRAQGSDAGRLRQIAENLERLAGEKRAFYENPCGEELGLLMARYPDLTHATRFEPELPLWVDRKRARFSSWYELFPRSASPDPRSARNLQGRGEAIA